MIVMPEIDLTPESASTLDRFRQLFWTGRFLWVAGFGAEALGTTDMQTLYRAMDRVVVTASGQQLCSSSSPLTPQEALEQAQASLAELKVLLEQLAAQALEWYEAQDADTQAAVLALLVSLRAWASSVAGDLSPEAQAALEALKVLLSTLVGEAARAQLEKRQRKHVSATNGRQA